MEITRARESKKRWSRSLEVLLHMCVSIQRVSHRYKTVVTVILELVLAIVDAELVAIHYSNCPVSVCFNAKPLTAFQYVPMLLQHMKVPWSTLPIG